MPEFSGPFVLFDTEYTSWEGAKERSWSGPNEYKEVIQIGALKVTPDLAETDSFVTYVKPLKNPTLSKFIIDLTDIAQETVDTKGVSLTDALVAFAAWSDTLPLWSHGNDLKIIEENCTLLGIPCPLSGREWADTREVFEKRGISTKPYSSGTILRAFGKEPTRRAHDAVNDMKNLLEALRELAKK